MSFVFHRLLEDFLPRLHGALGTTSLGLPEKVAVAVSGGLDSMALAYLAHHALQRSPCRSQVLTFTVDHQLRPESSRESLLVHQRIRSLGIHNKVLKLDWGPGGPPPPQTMEEHAREARYRTLGHAMLSAQCHHLLVGHHQGDVLETCLFRLSRASGIYGLGGMTSPAPWPMPHPGKLWVIRPLLHLPKSTLQQACMEQGIKWVEDPSNADTRYQRNAIRSFLTGQGLQGSKGCPLDLESTRAFFQRMNRHRHEIDQQAKQPPSQQDLRVLTFPIHLHGAVSEEMVWNDRFLLRVTRWGAYEKMASESAQVLFVRSYQPQDAKQFLRSAKKSAGTAVFHQRLKRGLDRIRNLCGPAGLSVLPVISTEDQVLSLPFLSTWGVDGLRLHASQRIWVDEGSSSFLG
ncbi:MAG: PP-loop family-domain-containing protein [Piptocephalis tieghemiana]|nr:MAG: PP-loop family-domain-containing protein [Piptocephalis tieghemiana]